MAKHTFRFGHAAANHGKRTEPRSLSKRAACDATTMYKSPASKQSVKAEDPFVISWDTACMAPAGDSVEISLHRPAASTKDGHIFTWSKVSWSRGSLETTIDPKWYGSTSTVDLQIQIKDSSLPEFWSESVSSPSFTVTYDARAAVSASLASLSAAGITPTTATQSDAAEPTEHISRFQVIANFFKEGLTKGQIAAAVILPILVVAACLVGYVIWSRKKETSKRKDWREKMDKRMSTISVDWKAMSAAGGHAAVRQSMAFSSADRNTRTSSFFGAEGPATEMRQTRPRNTSVSEANRVSRISFAESSMNPPSSMGQRPAVPPLPAAYRKSTVDQTTPPESMSPTQRAGAFVLDDDSIRDRLSAGNVDGRGSAYELDRDFAGMPAVAMMRNQSPNIGRDTMHEGSSPITPLTPALTREAAEGDHRVYSIGAYSVGTDSMVDPTPSVQSYFNQAPSSTHDPDAALRQYAATRAPVQSTASPFAGFAAGPGLAAAAGLDMSSPDAIFRSYAASRPAPAAPAAVATNTTGVATPRERSGTVSSGDSRNPYRDSLAPGAGNAH